MVYKVSRDILYILGEEIHPSASARVYNLEHLRSHGEEIMPNTDKKCAHPSCLCQVPGSDKYCSQICKDAGSDEVEIACECGHPPCEDMLH